MKLVFLLLVLVQDVLLAVQIASTARARGVAVSAVQASFWMQMGFAIILKLVLLKTKSRDYSIYVKQPVEHAGTYSLTVV